MFSVGSQFGRIPVCRNESGIDRSLAYAILTQLNLRNGLAYPFPQFRQSRGHTMFSSPVTGGPDPGRRIDDHLGGVPVDPLHHVQRSLRGQRLLEAASRATEAGTTESLRESFKL